MFGNNKNNKNNNKSLPKQFIPNGAALLNNVEETNELNRLYFSMENQQFLLNKLKYEVFKKTKIVIPEQNPTDLFLVMRGMYLENYRYLLNNQSLTQQINFFNQYVIDWCIPNIISNLEQHLAYLKDIDSPLSPIEHGLNTNLYGDRQLQYNNIL